MLLACVYDMERKSQMLIFPHSCTVVFLSLNIERKAHLRGFKMIKFNVDVVLTRFKVSFRREKTKK